MLSKVVVGAARVVAVPAAVVALAVAAINDDMFNGCGGRR